MEITNANLEALSATVTVLYNTGYEAAQSELMYKKIAAEQPSGSEYNEYASTARVARMKKRTGGPREITRPTHYDYKIFNDDREFTLAIPKNKIKDDKFGMYAPDIEDIGRGVAYAPQQLIFELVPQGLELKCFDGLPFFHTAHKRRPKEKSASAVKFSNKYNYELTPENYRKLYAVMRGYRDEVDNPWGARASILGVPPSLQAMGESIVEVETLPGGGKNPDYKKSELLVVDEWEDDPTRWYLFDGRGARKPFVYQKREEYVIVPAIDLWMPHVVQEKEFHWNVDGRDAAGFDRPERAITSKP